MDSRARTDDARAEAKATLPLHFAEPEQVVPVEPFVRELERRGMRVTRRVRSDRPRP